MVSGGGVWKRGMDLPPRTRRQLILSMADGTFGSASASGAHRRRRPGGITPTSPTSSARKNAPARKRSGRAHSLLKASHVNSIRQGIAVFDAHGALLAGITVFLIWWVCAAGAGGGQAHQLRASARQLPLSGAREMAGTRGRTLEVHNKPGCPMAGGDLHRHQRAQGR